MKNIIFKGTATATAKANNAQKIDNKNILDISYLIDTINSLDIEQYNNIYFSKSAIIRLLTEAATEDYTIRTGATMGGYIAKSITLDKFRITIETQLKTIYIYSHESGKQLYRYRIADNARIAIFAEGKPTAVFYETYNKVEFEKMCRSSEVEI